MNFDSGTTTRKLPPNHNETVIAATRNLPPNHNETVIAAAPIVR